MIGFEWNKEEPDKYYNLANKRIKEHINKIVI